MTRLSVNINKIATLRNARGGNIPNVLQSAIDCQRYGAEGITVHPRPDERHIRIQDVMEIKDHITTEFNIEGYPSRKFIELVTAVLPDQVTLVPDPPEAITSSAGWDTIKHESFLREVIQELQEHGIRTSIFIGTEERLIENAAKTGSNRVELYTEPYARDFTQNPGSAVEPFAKAAKRAVEVGLRLNAGHDLSLENLKFFNDNIEGLEEVSIGHALISDALYYGLENTIQMYRLQLISR
jgi:pyridoxine 5-phosphate synthase